MKIPKWYLESNYSTYEFNNEETVTNLFCFPEEYQILPETDECDIVYLCYYEEDLDYNIKEELIKIYGINTKLKRREWFHILKENEFKSICYVSYYYICG